jgi:hypothetical protein
MSEIRFALRLLARSPFLTAVVILSLGPGIGAKDLGMDTRNVVVFHVAPHLNGYKPAAIRDLFERGGEAGGDPAAEWGHVGQLADGGDRRSGRR